MVSARLISLGAVVGPINHYWYAGLDKFLTGNSAQTVVKKILLDQTIASPIFAFTFFMGKCISISTYKAHLHSVNIPSNLASDVE